MTDNKRVTNKQIMEKLTETYRSIKAIKKALSTTTVDLNLSEEDVAHLSIGVVSRMVKLKSMEDWFSHVNKTEKSWQTYQELDLSEEIEALGEAAKLMTLLNICQEDEEYEKCAIIKNRMDEVNRILKKYK